jgi:hypothetical protein
MIEQNVDIFHVARVIEGLPNLRAVNIAATIETDKLLLNQSATTLTEHLKQTTVS